MRPSPIRATPTRTLEFDHLVMSSSSLNLAHSQSLNSHGDELDEEDEPREDMIVVLIWVRRELSYLFLVLSA